MIAKRDDGQDSLHGLGNVMLDSRPDQHRVPAFQRLDDPVVLVDGQASPTRCLVGTV